MKLSYIKINILLALLSLSGLAQEKTIKLTGTMDPSLNGQRVAIMYGGFKKMAFDSTRVQDGKVSFELKNANAQIIHLSMGKSVPYDNLGVYIANSDVSFTVKDSLKNAVVSGNKLSEDYNRMNAPIVRLTNQRYAYGRKLSAIPAAQRKEKAGLEISTKIQELTKAEKIATYSAIDENPDSYIALLLLKTLAGGAVSYDEMMPHFEKLSKELKSTSEGKTLEEKIILVKGLRSGLVAADFESITPEGKRLKLSEVLPKAKYTFVDFWASWCIPCRAENPNVVKAYQQYGNKGLTILSVSLDTKPDLWKAAIEKDGMPWLHVSQLKGFDEPAAVLYRIKTIPQNVLIDSKGKIVASNLRGYALEEKLKQLMD